VHRESAENKHLKQAWRQFAWAAVLIVSSGLPARAQTIPVWPEIDTYIKLDDRIRLYFLATTVQENRESTEGEFGVNVDVHLKPLRRRTPLLEFRLDESKNRLLMTRIGYRYLPSYTGGSTEQRGVLEGTARVPLIGFLGDLLLSDRNRVDLRFIDGEFSWCYRNRLSAEREFSIGRVRLNPYARFEVYYDSRHSKWSRTELQAGSSFPVTRNWELESYFDYINDSSGSPTRQTKALGVVTTLYF
jgi:hypothetical protein